MSPFRLWWRSWEMGGDEKMEFLVCFRLYLIALQELWGRATTQWLFKQRAESTACASNRSVDTRRTRKKKRWSPVIYFGTLQVVVIPVNDTWLASFLLRAVMICIRTTHTKKDIYKRILLNPTGLDWKKKKKKLIGQSSRNAVVMGPGRVNKFRKKVLDRMS